MKTLSAFAVVGILAVTGVNAAREVTTEPAERPQRKSIAVASAQSARRGEEILRALENRYAQVTTIKCPFTQTTVDQTFGEKIESRGAFYLRKPSRLRVEYEPPDATTILVVDGYTYRYIPKLKQVERYRIDQSNPIVQTNYMLLGFGAATEDVLRAYKVSVRSTEGEQAGGKTWVVLTPRQPHDAAFKSIEMLVDDGRAAPLEFRVTQLDGTKATVRLDLERLTLDQRMDERMFRPSFPRDAQIVDMR
jgi:outer membrane lipoprotein-sorting protein